MKIASLAIHNFRTFDNDGISMTLENLTALIGENSTGKSNVLEALDLFFNYSKAKISKKCFHHDNMSNPIKIEVTFQSLNDIEKKKFRTHVDEKNSLIITQFIHLKLDDGQKISELVEDDYEFEESKHGTKWQAKSEWLNLGPKPPNKTNIKNWWKNDLIENDNNFKLLFEDPDSVPPPEIYQEKLEAFWDEHFEVIEKEKISADEKVLGWKNKLKGNLPKFFYVPAVRDVTDDIKVLKTNPFGVIIDWLTKNISDELRGDIEEKACLIAEEAFEKIDKDKDGSSKLGYLNSQLNENLGVNLGCKLEIKFGSPSFSEIVLPSPKIYADDGYYSEINLIRSVHSTIMHIFLAENV